MENTCQSEGYKISKFFIVMMDFIRHVFLFIKICMLTYTYKLIRPSFVVYQEKVNKNVQCYVFWLTSSHLCVNAIYSSLYVVVVFKRLLPCA